MSREERRNYQRQMKNVERGPSLPPAARARGERNAARRAARGKPTQVGGFTRRFVVMSIIVALAAGYFGFSFAYPNLPFAIYVGVVVVIIVLVVAFGLRTIQGRVAPR